MLYRTDYHIHSTFSDGKADPEEYVSAAKSAGLREILEFIQPLKLDYVIGSVHYMGDKSVDSSRDFYTGKGGTVFR